MQGPNEGIRAQVARWIAQIQSEGDMEELLYRIDALARDDSPGQVTSEEAAYAELAAVEAWASLASHAVQVLYTPGSPNWLQKLGHDFAGWSAGVVERLRKLADTLKDRLAAAARELRGVGFSIAVNFPIGVSIGISYTI
jgi:hypothetical protein